MDQRPVLQHRHIPLQLGYMVQHLYGPEKGIVPVCLHRFPEPGSPDPYGAVGAQRCAVGIAYGDCRHILQKAVGLPLSEGPARMTAPAPEDTVRINGGSHDEPRRHIAGILQQKIGLLPGQGILIRGSHLSVKAVSPGIELPVGVNGIIGISTFRHRLDLRLQRPDRQRQQHRRQQHSGKSLHLYRRLSPMPYRLLFTAIISRIFSPLKEAENFLPDSVDKRGSLAYTCTNIRRHQFDLWFP